MDSQNMLKIKSYETKYKMMFKELRREVNN
jgi:hypothetical protein